MPPLLIKTGRAFLAPARKPRPVFLPLKTAPPMRRRRDFSRQSEGRHNTLDLAIARCVPNGAAAPFGNPRLPCACPPASAKPSGFGWLTRALRAIQKPPIVLALRSDIQRLLWGTVAGRGIRRRMFCMLNFYISDIFIDNNKNIG